MSGVLTRGIRDNDPGNIDRDGTQWEGLSPNQSSDPRFCVFVSAPYGIRAIAMILINYQDKDGLHTIQDMINRWAPPNENDTAAYIKFVAGRVGISADANFNIKDYAFAAPMVEAIIAMENSGYAYPEGVLDAGLALAGIVRAATPTPAAQPQETAESLGARIMSWL
jgi:hypothetical protein